MLRVYCFTALAAFSMIVVLAVLAYAPGPTLASQVTAIAAGAQHTCAVVSDGGAKCWGHNAYGQVGDGTNTDRYSAVAVSGLTTGTSAVAVGGWHSCALTSAGGVKCWGANWMGQVGDDTTSQRNTPIDVPGLENGIATIAAGDYHSCARNTSGAVKCWGYNGTGAVGDGTTIDRFAPVDVSGLGAVDALALGGQHTCALTTAGGVKCWGANWEGQLGDSSTDSRLTPVDVAGLASGVIAIAAGENHSCAVTTANVLKCWGSNGVGQLGNGTVDSASTPVDVLSNVVSVDGGGVHTCARMSSGGVKCWGWDAWGQLGDGSTGGWNEYRATPGDVFGLTSGVSAVSAGSGHTCAVTPGSVVQCWGWNSNGQLGDGTTTDRASAWNDFDRDGCTNDRELQTTTGSQASGGRRNPKLFWDFFDVPTGTPLAKDRVVSTADVSAVQARFGSSGDPNGDPLSTPPPTGYHTAYDRTLAGPNSWNTGAPNGSITVSDISYVNNQVGHTCL